MKILYSFLLALLCLFKAYADERTVESEIRSVTVYTVGAQVSREARFNLQSGEQTLVFQGLSPYLDEASLQFDAGPGQTVISMKYERRYPELTPAQKSQSVKLNDEIKALVDSSLILKAQLATLQREETVLLQNTDFDIWPEMTATQLEEGLKVVRSRLNNIKRQRLKIEAQIDKLNLLRQEKYNALEEIRLAQSQEYGALVVKLAAAQAGQITAEINYVVADAGWSPYYDLKVEDLASDLQIDYRAKIFQNTGEDWQQVAVTLSTGNPYQEANLPKLNPWYLDFSNYRTLPNTVRDAPQRRGFTGTFQGVVSDAKTGELLPAVNILALDGQGNRVEGITSADNGTFALMVRSPVQRLQISYIGYQTITMPIVRENQFFEIKLQEATVSLEEVAVRDITSIASQAAGVTQDARGNTRSSRAENITSFAGGVEVKGKTNAQAGDISISQNPVNFTFAVSGQTDIPSDGREYKVLVKEYQTTADYLYRAVPKLNEHAFLTALLTDWEDLNLLKGPAGIYLEGNYLGETELNPQTAGDTLELSLGRDENVVVQRGVLKDEKDHKTMSDKIERTFHYQITLRNNKSAPLKIQITDQYPVSSTDEIRVKRMEHSKGQLNAETGIINWERNIEPAEELVLDLRYEVTYPQGRIINIY